MRDARRRPMGRLCYWVMMGIATVGLWVPGGWGQGGAPTTTVADNVYLADGTAAQGTMIVTWPAFQTASCAGHIWDEERSSDQGGIQRGAGA
jgi:hypothetical protein